MQNAQKTQRFFTQDGVAIAVFCRCALLARRRKKSDGLRAITPLKFLKDEVSSVAPVFQREEVKFAKPFLIWHVTEASH